ncbi:MAG: DNA polymerase III subunit alpha, partial [Clostridiales bacterium]
SGCVENKIDIKVAGEIFDLMEYFAGYGFNKSHSAAYALVSYQTAWLKANYPEEFMASMMTSVMDTADKVPEYIDECKRMGILVLPPDINESYVKFAVVGGKIRFALSAVKNVGREAVKRIVEERNAHGPYASMTDLCRRLPVNRKILESLVKCGAFDSLGVYRSRLLQAVDRALEIGKKVVQDKDSMQMSLFDFGIEDNQLNDDTEDFSNLPEYNAAELLAMEKEMIGFYVSGHPLDGYVPFFEKKNCLNTIALQEEESGSMINVGGQIGGLRTLLTKKGDSMAIFSLEDKYSAVKCIVFPRNYSELHSLILPDKVVIAEGKLQINEEQREIIVVNIKSAFKLYLRLPDSKGQIFIDKIKEFLLLYPGDGPVSVYYEDMKQYYDLPGVKGVAPDRVMLEHLQEWLGQANVVLK